MIYDISYLGAWIVLTLVVGAGIGWRAQKAGPQQPWSDDGFKKSLIAFAAGVVLVWLQWLPGRLGLWLETAVVFYAAYVVGCMFGVSLRTLTPSTAVTSDGAFASVTARTPPPVVEAKAAAAPVATSAPVAPEKPQVVAEVAPPAREPEPAVALAAAEPAPIKQASAEKGGARGRGSKGSDGAKGKSRR